MTTERQNFLTVSVPVYIEWTDEGGTGDPEVAADFKAISNMSPRDLYMMSTTQLMDLDDAVATALETTDYVIVERGYYYKDLKGRTQKWVRFRTRLVVEEDGSVNEIPAW